MNSVVCSRRWRMKTYFAKAFIADGAVVWPNGVDMAPDAMYVEVTGRPLTKS